MEINFSPSAKQMKVWKALTEPESPYTQVLSGGAAGGGKSYLGSAWLIFSCMKYAGWRMVVARHTLSALKESTVITILKIIDEWGIKGVNYNKKDNFLLFPNGSKILLKEMQDLPSDPNFSRFGSSEYSGAFVDEVDQVSQRAVEVLSSRLRWAVSEVGQKGRLLMSTNPCLGWVKDTFVMDANGEPPKMRDFQCYIPFSVLDNPDDKWKSDYMEQLERLTLESEKQRLLFGNWDYVDSNDAVFYSGFDGANNLKDNLFKDKYDKTKALYLSFDFNILPYVSCLAAQVDVENKKVRILKEILGKPKGKNNRTIKTASMAARAFPDHDGIIYITGDPSGIREDTRSDQGVNDFSQVMRGLREEGRHGRLKLIKKAPSVSLRGEWLNILFEGNNPEGWQIEIDMGCRKLTEDFIYGLASEDGSKDKKKVLDPDLKVRIEKYHHLSDAFDYLMLSILKKSYYLHKRGGRGGTQTKPFSSNRTSTSKHSW